MIAQDKFYQFLRWSEKYAKTDMVYLTHGSFWFALKQFIVIIMAFVSSIAFARFLPKEVYGQYKYILSIIAILSITSLSGIDKAVTIAASLGKDGVLKKGFKVKLKWSLLGSLGSVILAVYFWVQGQKEFSLPLLIAALFLPLLNSVQIFIAHLNGKKLFDLQAKYESITRIIASLVLILIAFLSPYFISIIIAYLVIYATLRTYFYYKTAKETVQSDESDPSLIVYGIHLSFLRCLFDIANQIDKIIIFKYLGAIQLAIYSFATIPIDQINSFLANIRILAVPKLSTANTEAIKKTLPLKIIKAIFIITIGVLVYIAAAPYIFKIFFPQYLDSIIYSRYYALSLILFPLSLIPTYFQTKIKKLETYILTIVPPFSKIALLIILTPLYGIMGVISAVIIAEIINVFLSLFFFKRNG